MCRKNESRFFRAAFFVFFFYYFLGREGLLGGTGGLPTGFTAVFAEAVTVFAAVVFAVFFTIVFAVVLLIFVYVVYVIFVKMFFNFYLIGHAPPAHSAISSISTFPDMIVIKGLTLELAAKYAASSIS